jgi:hypothetical protein
VTWCALRERESRGDVCSAGATCGLTRLDFETRALDSTAHMSRRRARRDATRGGGSGVIFAAAVWRGVSAAAGRRARARRRRGVVR